MERVLQPARPYSRMAMAMVGPRTEAFRVEQCSTENVTWLRVTQTAAESAEQGATGPPASTSGSGEPDSDNDRPDNKYSAVQEAKGSTTKEDGAVLVLAAIPVSVAATGCGAMQWQQCTDSAHTGGTA